MIECVNIKDGEDCCMDTGPKGGTDDVLNRGGFCVEIAITGLFTSGVGRNGDLLPSTAASIIAMSKAILRRRIDRWGNLTSPDGNGATLDTDFAILYLGGEPSYN